MRRELIYQKYRENLPLIDLEKTSSGCCRVQKTLNFEFLNLSWTLTQKCHMNFYMNIGIILFLD